MKIKTNPGIGIKLNLIEKNIIKININGINDLFLLKKVNYFVNNLFNYCIDDKESKKIKDIFDKYNKIDNDKLFDDDDQDSKMINIQENIDNKNDYIVLNNNDDDKDSDNGLDDYLDLLDEIQVLNEENSNEKDVKISNNVNKMTKNNTINPKKDDPDKKKRYKKIKGTF